MKRLIILLAEASLETIPKEIVNHPVIRRDAARRREDPRFMILDRARHHRAMLGLSDSERRGRPDITHQALLLIQGSLLAHKGLVKTYIHTINDVIIDVNPAVRPPRNYNNFLGLMSQLFREGSVPPSGEPLMRIMGVGVKSVLDLERPDGVFILDDVKGVKRDLSSFTAMLVSREKPLVVVGAYPHGAFSDYIYSLSNDIIKIGDYPMDTSWVLCKVITFIEHNLGLLS
ncbi:ribosome biogenesis protein [Vulcanisaeta thermophila]|uniref:ribosome biogenesis protein n=1 Tax=Vulcanisaeta thermophila TaxID=867917 RepID=UPI000853E751|nr:ribosome biogenesis protein [Vulcanisaeta thermophila]